MFLLKDVPKSEVIKAFARRMPDLDPSAAEACLTLLRTASDVMLAMDAHFTRHDISQGRFSILMTLTRSGGNQTPAELADRLGCTRATVTGLLDGLERDGLVERHPSSDDRRRIDVVITTKGRAFLETMLPDHFRRVAGLMSALSEKERRSLIALLAKVDEGIPALRDP